MNDAHPRVSPASASRIWQGDGAKAAHRFPRRAPPQALDPFDGVLLVDKPSGPTSHDVVAAIRRRFGFRKVGHGGTLDPQATGLLMILLGRGTKYSDRCMGGDKVYEGTLRLGVATDSQDGEGVVLREADFSAVTRDALQAEVQRMTGDMMQTPPMVSAVKVDGVPLYKLARRGQTVERQPKLIHVYAFEVLRFEPPLADFRLRCTKGTYVRTLCHDIGERLGCGAHLARLRRTQSGAMRVEDAVPFDAALALSREELRLRVIPLARLARA